MYITCRELWTLGASYSSLSACNINVFSIWQIELQFMLSQILRNFANLFPSQYLNLILPRNMTEI